MKKSLIIIGMTNWNWIESGVGFCWFFNRFYPNKSSGFLGTVLSRCLNPASKSPYPEMVQDMTKVTIDHQ